MNSLDVEGLVMFYNDMVTDLQVPVYLELPHTARAMSHKPFQMTLLDIGPAVLDQWYWS